MITPVDVTNRAIGHAPSVSGDDRHVTPSFLAEYWGVHINTIYRDIRKGALPAVRLPGGRFRVRWLEARRYGRPIE